MPTLPAPVLDRRIVSSVSFVAAFSILRKFVVNFQSLLQNDATGNFQHSIVLIALALSTIVFSFHTTQSWLRTVQFWNGANFVSQVLLFMTNTLPFFGQYTGFKYWVGMTQLCRELVYMYCFYVVHLHGSIGQAADFYSFYYAWLTVCELTLLVLANAPSRWFRKVVDPDRLALIDGKPHYTDGFTVTAKMRILRIVLTPVFLAIELSSLYNTVG